MTTDNDVFLAIGCGQDVLVCKIPEAGTRSCPLLLSLLLSTFSMFHFFSFVYYRGDFFGC